VLGRTLGILQQTDQSFRVVQQAVGSFVSGESARKSNGGDMGDRDLRLRPAVIPMTRLCQTLRPTGLKVLSINRIVSRN
jgi:hypothetical protein